MKIDAYSHFAPLAFLDWLEQHSGGTAHIFRQLFSRIPTLYDERARLQFKDEFAIKTSVLVPLPWIEATESVYNDPALAAAAARLCNDEIAALVARHGERFRGVALLPSVTCDGMLAEATRALDTLRACGLVIFVGPTAKPVDHKDYEPIFALAAARRAPIWLHPCRPPSYPDYVGEPRSQHLIWQTLGWLFDTSAAMVRMVFGGVFVRHPGLRVIAHHHGALVPLFYKRMQTQYEFFEQNTGAEFGPGLSQPYIHHFRKFYCDTATFGFEPLLLQLAVMFFGVERVLFGTDTPMDARGGAVMAGEAERSILAMQLPPADKARIFHDNVRRLLADGPHPLAAADLADEEGHSTGAPPDAGA